MKITAQDRATLLLIMERFPRQRVLVLGDLVADEYIYGEIARVSREAPVLILKQREKQVAPAAELTPPITWRSLAPRLFRWA